MDESLILLAKEVRGKTLRLIEGMDDAQARFAAPGLNNSILWNAGHALVVVEHLGIAAAAATTPIGKPSPYPSDWPEKFGAKSLPANVTAWPAIEAVRSALRDQLQRLTALIESRTEADLAKVIDPAKSRTLRYSILHGLHDEAGHQGEIYLLKKMYGKKL